MAILSLSMIYVLIGLLLFMLISQPGTPLGDVCSRSNSLAVLVIAFYFIATWPLYLLYWTMHD